MMILRHACNDLLNGSLSWQGTNVPVSDEKKKLGDNVNLFVTFGTQQESEDNTSDAFITDSSIDIQIQQNSGFEVSKDGIDTVSNQIMEILMPTPMTDGFFTYNNFQITCVRRERAISRNFSITDSESIVAKIITITCKIVQQFP